MPVSRRLRLQTIGCKPSSTRELLPVVDITERKRSGGKVRHVRMLGLCLVAALAMGATTLVVASPALAGGGCNTECKEQKQKEKEEARKLKEEEKAKKKEEKELKKHPEGVWEKFNECPLGEEPVGEGTGPVKGCIYGVAGKESFFQAGKVTIYFEKPVTLQGGFERTEGENYQFVGARNGKTITPEAEPAPSLTEGIDAELLPESEKTRYEEYLANGGSTKVTESIELAVPADDIYLNEENLSREEGEGFGFAVMVHIENKFLGNHCYDGTTVEPIDVPFTTGETHPEPPNTPIHGFLGDLEGEQNGEILKIGGQRLVNNEYAAPGVSGCGISGGADGALDGGLGLPSPAGSNTTILVGNLYQIGKGTAEEHLHW